MHIDHRFSAVLFQPEGFGALDSTGVEGFREGHEIDIF
jgi:hypothetical protein